MIKDFLTIQDAVNLDTSSAFTYLLHEVNTRNYAAAVVQTNSLETKNNRPSLRDDSSGEITIIPDTSTEERGSVGVDETTTMDDMIEPSNTDEVDGETITTVATPTFVPKNEHTNEEATLASNQESQYVSMRQEFDRMYTCYNNTGDFTKMMNLLWPAIQDFLANHPQHEHSKQWKVWITAGNTPDTDLARAKTIFGLPTLDQIYLFLRDSPALEEVFEISWNHKIHYGFKNSLETPTRANTFRDEYPISSFVDFSCIPESFEPFHHAIFTLLSSSDDMTAIQRQIWEEWARDGLTASSSLAEVYDQFNRFNTLVRITWTPEKDGFAYHITQPSSDCTNRSLEIPQLSHMSHVQSDTNSVQWREFNNRISRLEASLTTINTVNHFTKPGEVQHTIKSFIQEEMRNLDKAVCNKSAQFQEQIERTGTKFSRMCL
jgi:hypothetical protein